MDENGDAPREVRAARVRAARAYAGLDQAEIARCLGVSTGTIKRLEAGKREVTLEEMMVVADRCDVPPVFMLVGFGAAPLTLEQGQQLRDEITEAVRHDFDQRFAALARAMLTEYEARTVARDAIAHLIGDDGD